MKVEQAKQIANKAIEQLSEALDRGHSETLRNYLAAMARFHRYSLHNLILIVSQRPDATRVAGFHTWKQLGRNVKKGAKGIMILAPVVFRKSKEEATSEEDQSKAAVGFRAVYVWDEQQTTGKELPQIGSVTGDPSFYLARLEEFVRARGIRLDYSADIAPARGMAEKGKITLLPDQTPAETFATLVHELAHSDMHFGERRGDTNKRIRETEAESVAYVVCSAIGLETGTAAQDYLGLYGGDSKLLLESLEYVQATASRILDAIEERLQQQAA